MTRPNTVTSAAVRAFFAEVVECDMPEALPIPEGLEGSERLAVSPGITRDRLFLSGDAAFDLAEGAFVAGFWGYGASSYAFYYIAITARYHVYLRVGYGGAYANAELDRAELVGILDAVATTLTRLDELGIHKLCIQHNMGHARYAAVDPSGAPVPCPPVLRPALGDRWRVLKPSVFEPRPARTAP